MKIVNTPIGDITPYHNNPRINTKSIKYVASSIKEFGWQQPIVVDENNVIIVGHSRYQAAKSLDLLEVPVLTAEDLSPEQVAAYRIADNKVRDYSVWDDSLLVTELKALDGKINLELTGFDSSEIEQLIKLEIEEEDNTLPDPPKHPKSEFNKIYKLGKHKLLVGDSLDAKNYKKLLGDERVDLLLTDPPYNINYEAKSTGRSIINDDMDDNAFIQFLTKAFKCVDTVLKDGAAFYIWHSTSCTHENMVAIKNVKWLHKQTLVWVKDHFSLTRQDYQWQHEPCLYGWKKGTHKWYGGFKHTTIKNPNIGWNISKSEDGYTVTIGNETYLLTGENLQVLKLDTETLKYKKQYDSTLLHPTVKPNLLFRELMANSSKKDDVVLDNFAGSGTTVIVAEDLNRKARVIELDPAFGDVIRQRWAEHVHGEGCDWQTLTPEISND